MKQNSISLKNESLRSSTWLFSGKISIFFFQTLILAILARLVSPEEFGIMSASLVIYGFATVFSEVGIGPALVQHTNITEKHINTGFTSSMLLGVVLILSIYFLAEIFAIFMGIPEIKQVIRVLSILFFLESIKTTSYALLQKKMNFKYISIIESISYVLGYGLVSIILAYHKFGIWALVYGMITASVFQITLYILKVNHKWKFKIHWIELKELFSYSSGYTLARLANYAGNNGDNLLVGKLMGTSALGFYSRGYVLMIRPVNLIADSMMKALFPAFSSIKNQNFRLKSIILRAIELILTIGFSLSVLLFHFSDLIVLTLFGNEWTMTTPVIQAFALVVPLRLCYRVFDTYLKSTGKVYSLFLIQVVYMICTFSSVYLAHPYGIKAVAFSVVGAFFINYFLFLLIVVHSLGITFREWIKTNLKGLFWATIIILALAVSHIFCQYIGGTQIFGWIIDFSLIILCIAIGIYFLGSKMVPKDVLTMLHREKQII